MKDMFLQQLKPIRRSPLSSEIQPVLGPRLSNVIISSVDTFWDNNLILPDNTI